MLFKNVSKKAQRESGLLSGLVLKPNAKSMGVLECRGCGTGVPGVRHWSAGVGALEYRGTGVPGGTGVPFARRANFEGFVMNERIERKE
jgi:hypothetical protein